MKRLIAGIDIGGTKIAVALATPDCRIVSKSSFPTEAAAASAHQILHKTLDELEKLVALEQAELFRIGVACAGPLDAERRLALSPPNLPGWDEFPIVEIVNQRIKVSVVMENDANAAALAEQQFGAGKNFKNLIYITISTGIGGGVIVNGKLLQGVTGNAGEVGHITVMPNGITCGCGARGCLEAVCSGTGIARRFAEKLSSGAASSLTAKVRNPSDINARMIAEAVASGDRLATEIWDETIFYLSIGIGNMIVMFEPEAIILGGGVSLSGDQLFPALRRQIQTHVKILDARNVQILPAGLGADSGIYGALVVAAAKDLER